MAAGKPAVRLGGVGQRVLAGDPDDGSRRLDREAQPLELPDADDGVVDDEIDAVCGFWREQGGSQHTADDEAELEKLARQEDPEERLLAQARQILLEHDGDITPGYLARKLKIGIQKATRIHQSLVADEAAAYAGPSLADD